MNNMRKILFLTAISFLLLLTSCVTTMPLNKSFYNPNKVGVIYVVDDIGMAKSGSQGLLDMAVTPGNKYKEPLSAIEEKLNYKQRLIERTQEILNAKNKQFVEIDYDLKNAGKFDKPKSNKKFYKLDVRQIKEKYDVDEVLIIHAKYGILVSYYGMIETGKQGYTQVFTDVVDLSDNALLMQDTFQIVEKIDGNWKKGEEYSNLSNSISSAIDKALSTLQSKF